MFCADYVAAFVFHGIFTAGSVLVFGKNNSELSHLVTHDVPTKDKEHMGKTLLLFSLGALGLQYSNKNELHINELMKSKSIAQDKSFLSNEDRKAKTGGFILPTFVGLTSGLCASVTLYPFDFVRGGVLQPGLKRILSAASTVPYAGTLFGMYFYLRDPENTASQVKWAACSSTCAVLAEAPFDHAKRTMIGSTRVMIGAGFLYVPFATIMLVMYDKAIKKFVDHQLYC